MSHSDIGVGTTNFFYYNWLSVTDTCCRDTSDGDEGVFLIEPFLGCSAGAKRAALLLSSL